jgi:SpoVK/Ycf46/Vps4 family AAA+-type ATPase
VLFDMPGVEERARIWELQIHPKKTPLGADVDFRRLAERYEMSGGDIKNGVIKAAAAAAAEPGSDLGKQISQQHFERAAQDVLSAKSVMQQSLFAEGGVAASDPMGVWRNFEARWRNAIVVALGLAGTALIAALVALGLALLR